MLKRIVSVLLLLGIAACGGGGGGGEQDPGGGPGIRPTGSLSGRVEFVTGVAGMVIESEPNDTLGDGQILGDLPIGARITVLGSLSATGGVDLYDGFRIRVPKRARITATLSVENPTENDFDLAVYDPVVLQYVESYPSPTTPTESVFFAEGSLDLVLSAVTGDGAYELQIRADLPAAVIQESEPNDDPGEAQYVGQLVPGTSLLVGGTTDPATDPRDAVLVTCPAAADLTFTMTFPAFSSFALRVLDATADLVNPTPLLELPYTTTSPREGQLTVPAGKLLHVEVSTDGLGGTWRVDVAAADPAGSPKPALLVPDAGIASLDREQARVRTATRARYGRSVHPLMTGEAIVRFDDAEGAAPEAELGSRAVKAAGKPTGRPRRVVFDVPEGLDEVDQARYTLARVRALEGCSGAVWCEPNYVYQPLAEPDDTYYSFQWHYPMINLPDAWDITTGSPDVIVAVIDTGRTQHPDLAGRQSGGYDMISDPSISLDGDGWDPDPTDVGDQGAGSRSTFHGTHVAGTIGATTDNELGVAGVTWETTIMHVRALGRGGGTTFDIANAIRYAARLVNDANVLPPTRAHVINMSLGGAGSSQTMAAACAAAWNAGVVIFASTGNSSSSAPLYPAAYADTISVMAVDASRTRAPYSSYGTTVDLAAPGGNTSVDLTGDGYVDGVLSTLYDDSSLPAQPTYAYYQGTSMACPHAAGVAALMLSIDPTLTPDEIRTTLHTTADDLGATGKDSVYGYGLIDAFRAVQAVAPVAPPLDPVLSVAPTSLNFGLHRTTMDLHIDNLGDGMLNVGPVTWNEEIGTGWLSAELIGIGDANQDANYVRVTVDRFGLLTRNYLGSVTVASSAGTIEVPVAMGVLTAPPPPPYLDIHVQVIRVDTGEVMEQTTVNPAGVLDFTFPVLPIGEYIVVAGTDIDGDDILCEEGDYCGAWPVLGEPAVVTVLQNLETNRVNFNVFVPAAFGAAR